MPLYISLMSFEIKMEQTARLIQSIVSSLNDNVGMTENLTFSEFRKIIIRFRFLKFSLWMASCKRICLAISILGTVIYLIKLIWSKRTVGTTDPSTMVLEVPEEQEEAPEIDDTFDVIDDNEDDVVPNDGHVPVLRNTWQSATHASAIFNSNNSQIHVQKNLHVHRSPYNKIEEDMIDMADYQKMVYWYSIIPLQEKNMEFNLLNCTDFSICSSHNLDEIFLPSIPNTRRAPRRILVLDDQNPKIIGGHLACVWGTEERSFMDNFWMVYLITAHANSTVQNEILNICGNTGSELEPTEIFRSIRGLRRQAQIIIEDLDSMDPSRRQDLRKLLSFNNHVNSEAKCLRLATFVIISSSVPTDGEWHFDKIIRICPSLRQLLM